MDVRPSSRIVIIRGTVDNATDWANQLSHHYMPGTWVYPIPETVLLPEEIAAKKVIKGKTVAYICQGYECSAAVESIDALKASLLKTASS
jgi:uncharacterized protein YyaL (SSP411 family)